jgi:hypothetical protein
VLSLYFFFIAVSLDSCLHKADCILYGMAARNIFNSDIYEIKVADLPLLYSVLMMIILITLMLIKNGVFGKASQRSVCASLFPVWQKSLKKVFQKKLNVPCFRNSPVENL